MPKQPKEDKFCKKFIDASPNLIFATDGTRVYFANQTLLHFLDYPSTEAFLKKYTCVCDFFEDAGENAIVKQMRGLTWLEYLIRYPHSKNRIYLRSHTQNLHIFKVNIIKIVFEGQPLYAIILNDISEIEIQKERYQQAIEGSEVGIWEWNIQTNEIYFSRFWKAILGFDDDEFPNLVEAWHTSIHPDDFPSILEAIKANQKGWTESFEHMFRQKHKDGHWVWIYSKGKTFRDPTGVPSRMVGMHHDITHIKESEERNLFYAERSKVLLQLSLLKERRIRIAKEYPKN